jgi:hypothetical protein
MKQPKKHPFPRDRLFQKMSEVLSLREQVAQAELAARTLEPVLNQRDEVGAAGKGKLARRNGRQFRTLPNNWN